MPPDRIKIGVLVTIRLSDTAEAASSKTLAALAQVIQALAPEVCSVSFHDAAADTLWLSEDFLPPEDHQLVQEALSGNAGGGAFEMTLGAGQDGGYAVAIPVCDSHGCVNGAVRLSIDSRIEDVRTAEPLQSRLAPLWVCVAAEFERRGALPWLPRADQAQLALIENALHAECFELFLQPICALQEPDGLAHYEVLLRLRTSDGKLLEPGAFLRTAAERHLMPAIDRWVVRSLLVWLVNNRKSWARVPAVFSINLAPQSMTDANFVSYVESCVLKSGLPPQALCFEITEQFASSGNISVAESMKRLEALGCEVALDDFGGHTASFDYLRTMPAHYFKIDSALVGAAPTDRGARAIISAIVRMAGDLGVQTVAESVELDAELQAMLTLGVDYAQGYLLGRPRSLSGYDFERRRSH
jgi:EAL domain-containing protein (putative c-di-GMP-specific phosphodiesterase class I)